MPTLPAPSIGSTTSSTTDVDSTGLNPVSKTPSISRLGSGSTQRLDQGNLVAMNQLPRVAARLLLMTLFCASSGLAQSGIDEVPTAADLRSFKTTIERNTNPDDQDRAEIIEAIDAALGSLQSVDSNRAATAASNRRRDGVDSRISALRSELDRPAPTAALNLPAHPTPDQAEDALARERARHAANIAALREEQQVAVHQRESRSRLAHRLGELDLDLELLNRELRAAEGAEGSELNRALRMAALARRQAAKSEIEMLRAQLMLLSDESALIPLNVDLAQRRVTTSQALVRLHEEKAHELRTEHARKSLESVRTTSRDLANTLPSMATLAEETERLAEGLWGPDGIVVRSEDTTRDIDALRSNQAHLSRIAELTARKFEVYGHRGSVKRWWPEIPESFPEHGAVAGTMRQLDQAIPEIEHLLITYEQERTRAYLRGTETEQKLRNELGEDFTPELAHEVRTLLEVRQELLDQSIAKGRDYSNLLTEHRSLIGFFFSQYQAVEEFLYSHVLWSRSVPRPIIPRPGNLTAAAGWLTSAGHRDALSTGGRLGWKAGLAIVVLLFLVAVRPPLRRRLNHIADRVEDPEHDHFGRTVEALLITAILAAPLPVTLYFLSTAANRFGSSPFWYSAAEAFLQLAVIAAFLELLRHVFAPRGLAEVHFGWPVLTSRPSSHGLIVAEALSLPLIYVALNLAFAGMRLNSPAALQLHNNTLGRMAFIGGLTILGLLILALTRPNRKAATANQGATTSWKQRFAEFPLLNVVLAIYPAIIVATLVPALLAALGYYLTALLLAYQMLRTLIFVFAVFVVGGVVQRWRRLNRQRRLAELESGSDDSISASAIEADDGQVRELFRFTLTVVMVLGLLSIWSDALPMFDAFKRVQLLPKIAILDPRGSVESVLGLSADTAPPSLDEPAVADEAPATGESAASTTDAETPGTTDAPTLTLWNLLEAMLAGLVTFVLVKNLPGVVEIILKRRSHLDRGARFAFSTLLRYTITIVGSIVVFSLLGIGWSKVQWLAAALTFGLGFGLQEIVANFVSGLILLVERPVRVGDMVTVGNLMGRVSRIQIRATTITLLDRSEMVVPNKEFITTKLVNWTLTDSKRRIEIPLRIAHGVDLDEVKSLLINAAKAHPLVLDTPAPQALLIEFADDAIIFELRFVVDFGNGIQAKDEVQMAIDQAFKASGIDFAVPQIKLHLPEGVASHGD